MSQTPIYRADSHDVANHPTIHAAWIDAFVDHGPEAVKRTVRRLSTNGRLAEVDGRLMLKAA